MLILLALPVVALVTVAQLSVRRYAPSNQLIRLLRARPNRWRTAAIFFLLTAASLASAHIVVEAVASGAPGWCNLIVLFLVLDAIKFGLQGIFVGSCALAKHALRTIGSQR